MSLIPVEHDPFWRETTLNNQPLSLFPNSSVGMPDFFQRSIREMERNMQEMDRQMRTFMRQSTQQAQQIQQQQPSEALSIFPYSMNDRSTIEPAVITDANNNQRKLVWNFDCNAFKPEDITITTTGNTLEVKARHEDRGQNHQQVREFTRTTTLPESIKAQEMRSRLTNNGVLTIEAPYHEQDQQKQIANGHGQEREIQIRHT